MTLKTKQGHCPLTNTNFQNQSRELRIKVIGTIDIHAQGIEKMQ